MNSDTHGFYTIRLEGILDRDWAVWFDGMTLTYPENAPNQTLLSGYLVDQSALHGLLERIRTLNLELIYVARTDPPAGNQEHPQASS